jgi:hypothetical protein
VGHKPKWSFLMKKNGGQKTRDRVPLMIHSAPSINTNQSILTICISHNKLHPSSMWSIIINSIDHKSMYFTIVNSIPPYISSINPSINQFNSIHQSLILLTYQSFNPNHYLIKKLTQFLPPQSINLSTKTILQSNNLSQLPHRSINLNLYVINELISPNLHPQINKFINPH